MPENEARSISDYFPVKPTEFKVNIPLPVVVYLYFTRNHHILAWKNVDDILQEEEVKKVISSNMQNLYVHKDDRAFWDEYCTTDMRRVPDEASLISMTMSSDALNDTDRKIITQMAGLELVRNAGEDTSRDQKRKLRSTSEVLIALQLEEKTPGLSQIWKLAYTEPSHIHGRNVASLSMTFALALGKNDKEILSDLMVAALLHDLGWSYISANLVSHPIQSLDETHLNQYYSHVPHTLEILNQVLPKASVRLKNLIQMHHEKFGPLKAKKIIHKYPSLIYSQILALAEMVETVGSGLHDGKKRTLKETFQYLFEIEQAGNFPDYFDPGVFLPIYQAIHNVDMVTVLQGAKPVVKAYIDIHPLNNPESDI